MSRTTTALKRLGVPSLAAVTLVAGLPLFLGTAQAAHISGLTLSPNESTDNIGVCVPYTADLQFTDESTSRVEEIDVVLTETTPTATADIDFCTVASNGFPAPATPQDTSDTGAAGNGDRAEFTTDANGTVTFGVTSNEAGSFSIQAFYETTDNDTFNAGEFQDTSTQTFAGGGTAGSNANQNAATFVEVVNQGEVATATATVGRTGDTDVVVETETRTYRVFVGSDNNSRLAGVTVSFVVDSTIATADRGVQVFGVTDNNGIATGTIMFPARAEGAGNNTSTDNVTFFVQQTGLGTSPALDPTEPRDELTVVVRDNAAQAGRTVTLTALPDADATTGTSPNQTTNPNYSQSGDAAVNPANDGDRTFRAVVDATGTDSTAGTLLSFGVTGGSGDETVSPVEDATADNTGTTDVNDSFVDVIVNDPTPTVGQTLTVVATIRGTSAADTGTLTFRNQQSDARFVDLEPENVTVAPNTAQQLTATVTDVDGNPVAGVTVEFNESGAGAFRNGNSRVFAETNSNGVATAEVISLPGETGTTTVTASIGDFTQCDEAANTGTDPQGNALNSTNNTGAAGVCADSVTVTFGTASPSPSASPTGTTSPTPASPGASTPPSNVDCSVTPTVDILDATIIATGGARIRVNAPANSTIEVLAYSRPSTTYRVVRRAEINADGDPANFLVTPPTNTRLYAQIVGCDTDEVRFSKVINVRTQLSLNVERLGKQTYRFFGDSLPARRGGLIVSLYRVTDSGRQVLTSQVRANELGAPRAGEYSITRTFTGTGRFGFVVRTGQDLQNAPGSSNVRSLLIF